MEGTDKELWNSLINMYYKYCGTANLQPINVGQQIGTAILGSKLEQPTAKTEAAVDGKLKLVRDINGLHTEDS